MRMEQLEYFVEVAKYHSIGIAAEKLFVSQPAVSVAIKKLEEELDCVLLERSKNGVQLTAIGVEVYKKSLEILKVKNEMCEMICNNNEGNDEELNGKLKVLSSPVLIHSFLQVAIFEFLSKNDKVSFELQECNREYITENILNREIDIGFNLVKLDELKALEDEEDIYVQKLFSEKLYLVAHKKFGLGGKLSLRTDEIIDFPQVSFSATPITNFNILLAEKADEAKIILKTYSFDLLKKFIFNGNAVSCLTGTLINKLEDTEMLDIIPIIDLVPGNACYLYRKDNPNLKLIQALEKEIMKHC